MGQSATTDRLDVWRDVIRENFVALDIAADRRDLFAGSVQSSDLGHLNVASVRSGAQAFTRTAELARADDDVYLQVGLLARGAAVLQQDGREALLAPGDFAVYETDRPFCWALQDDWELLVFTWPRASIRLHDTVSQALTARCLSGRDGLGSIVGRMLRDLAKTPPALSAAGGIRLGDQMAELVTTVAEECVHPAGPERSAEGLLRRIDDYIADHLADPNLGPTEVAAALYISTRHLHRLFAGRGGTVTQQIQRLRLERARLQLIHTGATDRSITEVARRWGFADLATFSRAFRAAYGVTPTHYRSAAAATNHDQRGQRQAGQHRHQSFGDSRSG